MSLIPYNPFKEIDNINREMSTFFEHTPFRFLGIGNSPRVDVYQTENDIIMKAEIPGVDKKDLNVYVDENSIRISGQSKRSDKFNDENIYRTERYYGSFSRTVPLPVEIKSDQVKAEYKDGILSISAPKLEPSKSKGKKIDIQ